MSLGNGVTSSSGNASTFDAFAGVELALSSSLPNPPPSAEENEAEGEAERDRDLSRVGLIITSASFSDQIKKREGATRFVQDVDDERR